MPLGVSHVFLHILVEVHVLKSPPSKRSYNPALPRPCIPYGSIGFNKAKSIMYGETLPPQDDILTMLAEIITPPGYSVYFFQIL